MKWLWVWALVGACEIAFAANSEEPLGLLLSVQGDVKHIVNEQVQSAKPFQYIKRGERIQVQPGAELLLSSYLANALYEVSGPSLLEFRTDQIVVVSGKSPVVRPLQDAQIRRSALTRTPPARPGSVTMKAIPWPVASAATPALAQHEAELVRPSIHDDQVTWLLYVAGLNFQGRAEEAQAALAVIGERWPQHPK